MLHAYRDEIRETLVDFQDSPRLKKACMGVLAVCGLYAERRIEADAIVLSSVEAMWHGTELDDAVLQQELKEIMGES